MKPAEPPITATGTPPRGPRGNDDDSDIEAATRAIEELEGTGEGGEADEPRPSKSKADRRPKSKREDAADEPAPRRRAKAHDDEGDEPDEGADDDAGEGEDDAPEPRRKARREEQPPARRKARTDDDYARPAAEDDDTDPDADPGDEEDDDETGGDDPLGEHVDNLRLLMTDPDDEPARPAAGRAPSQRPQGRAPAAAEDDTAGDEPADNSADSVLDLFDRGTLQAFEEDVSPKAAKALAGINGKYKKLLGGILEMAQLVDSMRAERSLEQRHQTRTAIDELSKAGYAKLFGTGPKPTPAQDKARSAVLKWAVRYKSTLARDPEGPQFISLPDAVKVAARALFPEHTQQIERDRAQRERAQFARKRHSRLDVLPGRGAGGGRAETGDEDAAAAGAVDAFMRRRGVRA